MDDEYKVYSSQGKLLHKGTVGREEAAKLYNWERDRTRGSGKKPVMVRQGKEKAGPGPGDSE